MGSWPDCPSQRESGYKRLLLAIRVIHRIIVIQGFPTLKLHKHMLAMKFAPTLTVALILSLISLSQILLNFFKPIKAANVTNVSQLFFGFKMSLVIFVL